MQQIKKVEDLESYRSELSNHEEKRILVKFEADWCGPCKAMGPVVEEVARQFPDVKVIAVDIEGDGIEELLREYDVKSVPTFIKIDSSRSHKRLCGTASKSELSTFLLEENACG